MAHHRIVEAGLGLVLGYYGAATLDFITAFPPPAKLTMEIASADPRVQSHLGQPIRRAWFWDGSVTDFQASVTLRLTGPKASGAAIGRLLRDDKTGQWTPLLVVAKVGDEFITVVSGLDCYHQLLPKPKGSLPSLFMLQPSSGHFSMQIK